MHNSKDASLRLNQLATIGLWTTLSAACVRVALEKIDPDADFDRLLLADTLERVEQIWDSLSALHMQLGSSLE